MKGTNNTAWLLRVSIVVGGIHKGQLMNELFVKETVGKILFKLTTIFVNTQWLCVENDDVK